MPRLKIDPATLRELHNALAEGPGCQRAPETEKSRNSGAASDVGTAIDAAAAAPRTVGDDPDDDDDPDDNLSRNDAVSGTVDFVYTLLPEMPAAWWARMVADPDLAPVSSVDAELVFKHIECRLMGEQTARPPSQQPQDGQATRLMASPDGDSEQKDRNIQAPGHSFIAPNCQDVAPKDDVGLGRHLAAEAGSSAPVRVSEGSIAFGEVISPVTTVGELHSRIEEHYGLPGWTALVECWHKACGIEAPAKEEKRQPKNAYASNPAEEPHGKPDSAEQLVTRQGFTSQARVMRWFERPEPVPPAWRHQESAGEKELRESMEETGTWCG